MPKASAAPASTTVPSSLGFLIGRGNMADLVLAKNWSATPLGPIEQWPQSLRTTVSLCLASNFPISIAWGPQRVQIYNDGYRPLCGDKHPTSLGQDYKECWATAWQVLGEAFEAASAGQTRLLENQRMFLDRSGYLEETFFTFSFSPILDESGGVGGVFHPVTELTQQTLAERRLNILRTVPERTGQTQTEQRTAALLLETFREFDLDLPFALLYSLAPDAPQAQLQGQVGLTAAGTLAPATVALDAAISWPLAEAARTGQAQQLAPLAATFGDFAGGPYPEAPHTALVYPLYLNGAAQPAYFLVLGVSARRDLDAEYGLFYDLLAAAATTALAKARTLEEERKRVQTLAELDQAKTALSSNISHEFRTPLTCMSGPLEDALPNALPADEAPATILVVADNADVRDYVQRILARQPRWTIHTAADGVQALAAVAAHRPDLVLSDAMMQHLDGFGLLQALKQDPATAQIPVVLLSARAGDEATVEGLPRGADDYLIKPFGAPELLARVRTQLDLTRIRQDNTRLRAAEEELKKFKVLSDHAFDALILMRADGSFAYLNDLAHQRWGYSPDEAQHLRVPDVDPYYQADEFRALFARVQQQGSLPPFETLHQRKDGTRFPVEVSLGTITLGGEPHLFAIARDITEQVAAKQQLVASEQRYRTLIEESPVAMSLYLGPDIRIQHANTLMLSYWGKDASVAGKSFRAALPELQDQPFPALLEQVYATGKAYVGVRQPATLLVNGQPKTSYFTFTFKPLHDELGHVYGIHHTAVDVTEEVRALRYIEESEARFRALVEQSPVPVALTRGLDVVIENINAPMLRLMSLDPTAQVLGKPLLAVLPQLESEAILSIVRNVTATGEPFRGNEMPIPMRGDSGELELRYYNVSYSPLIEDGQVQGVIHVAIDTTEQVRARQKLEGEKARAQLAIEVGGLGVFETDFATQEIVGDARFNEIFGFDRPQPRDQYMAVFHPDDLPIRAQALALGLQSGAFEYEVRLLPPPARQVRWVRILGRVYRDATGAPATVLGVAQDITEQKSYTEALHESEQRFRTLADAAPNMVWAVNPDSSIRYINRAFTDFVGVTAAQYEATGWGPYMHPDELTGAQAFLSQAIATRTPYVLEHRMRRHDAQFRWLLAQGAPSYFPNGDLYGYVGSAIDITELKEANEQLVRTNRDLDNFIYTASHDLKAPISNIEGLLRLLEDLLPPALRTDDAILPVLTHMQDAVERFTRTISHLTEVSKLQLEFAQPATPTALLPLLEDVRQDLLPLLTSTSGHLTHAVEGCPTLVISEKNLRSILYNLVSNALKYRHPDRPPVVHITCHREAGRCLLQVHDNGLGLSDWQKSKLFQLFGRLHTHVEGTGVGLYMVKNMVENAGGTISVHSKEGQGSTFTASFPT